MNERSFHVLEFNKIIDHLKDLCVSDMGRELAGALMPSSNFEEVTKRQEETAEAEAFLSRTGGTPIMFFADVRQMLRLAEIGSTLSPKMLLNIAGVLRAAKAAKEPLVHSKNEPGEMPRLYASASNLGTLREIEQAITDAIMSEEEIADRASPELYNIRRKIRTCNERVRDKLNSMIHSASFQKYLQDPIVTMRSDRYVLPVKQEYRQMVPGIVHDQSTTGATVFVEPMAVVEIGNELKQLVAAEKAEIERILRALSAQIAPEVGTIETDLNVLAFLDFTFAKALLGHEMHAQAPQMNREGKIRILRGRHPLIDPEKVVPLDIHLGETFTTLVITGPNTGGKTVSLKTVGLFCAMAQAGLQVSADYGTTLPVFDEIFADIGDEQSIEQSLSTFSGHMRNIVTILSNVTPDSLVLFDELGAGTDPTEGAALAQSILSNLLRMKTRTLATTHYSELKEYAMTTPGAENASVEFDVATLAPTYHLLIGIPGKSNAFEISRKLGLPEYIIDSAKELLSKDQIRFEDVLANAESYRQQAEKERELAESARKEMMSLRNQVDLERKKLEDQRERLTAKAKEDAKRIVENARRESESLIEELRKQRKAGTGIQEHEVQKVRQAIDQLRSQGDEQDKAAGEPLKEVAVGDLVHIISMDADATVTSLPDAKGYVNLKAGMMRMRAQLSDLRSLTSTEKKSKKEKNRYEVKQSAGTNRVNISKRAIRQELDIRGLAADEAIPEVQKFIDDAVLSSLGEICIIHGVGTGILRAKVQEYLRRNAAVVSFRAGRYGEGEAGVTIVTLK
ncbi:MAG: endonuclease MutS2 [Clostridia bacterium]|nr:endonuclease MutS2 [Clostridia bacterium]